MINQRARWLSTMLYCNAVVPSVELLKMMGRDRPRACAIQGRRASGHRGFVREYLQFFRTDTASAAPDEFSACIASETSQLFAVTRASKITPN